VAAGVQPQRPSSDQTFTALADSAAINSLYRVIRLIEQRRFEFVFELFNYTTKARNHASPNRMSRDVSKVRDSLQFAS